MKTFVFDLYNTLVKTETDYRSRSSWQPVVEFFRERGLETDWESLRDWFDVFLREQLDELKAQGDFAYPEADVIKVFQRMAENLGGEFSAETAEEAVLCAKRAFTLKNELFDGTVKLIAALKATGAKLYILSNAQAVTTRGELDELRFTEKFDGILLSSECGCKKPDPKFFKMLFDKYDIEKKTAVMVGDELKTDIAGAKAFGIKSVWAKDGAPSVAQKLLKLAGAK